MTIARVMLHPMAIRTRCGSIVSSLSLQLLSLLLGALPAWPAMAIEPIVVGASPTPEATASVTAIGVLTLLLGIGFLLLLVMVRMTISSRQLHDAQRKIQAYAALLDHDIAERKRAEEDLASSTGLQKLLMELALGYVNVPLDELDHQIDSALARIGSYSNVDRAHVFRYDFSKGVVYNTHEWCAPGILPQKEHLQDIPLQPFAKWVAIHRAGRVLHIPSVEQLPAHNPLRQALETQGIKTFINVPLMLDKTCMGFIGFDAIRETRQWGEREISPLRVLAELLVNTEKRQRAAKEICKLGLAVAQSPESIIVTNLAADIEYVNEAFERNTGFTRDEVLGQNPRFLQSGKTPAATYQELWDTLQRGESWRGELINRRKDGSEHIAFAIISPVRERNGHTSHYVAIEQDVTERKQTEARIHNLAFFDSLTALPNRSLLLDRLAQRLTIALRQHRLDALLLLNIDRFKVINNARGNLSGDALLRAMAHRLRMLTRPGDTVARMAADEFAILSLEVDQGSAQASSCALEIAEKIHAALLDPFVCEAETFVVTVSIGIALSPIGVTDRPANVLQRADTALHRAKASGGNQSAIFETGMDESSTRLFQIERELREALTGQQLQLYLQPQVCAHGHLVGAEALLRWQHPHRGLVSPAVFIPIAEESNLIVDLGIWVMTEACRILAQTHSFGPSFRLSVNVSARHFRQAHFAPWLKGLLAATGADPLNLTLEITESLFLDNLNAVVAKMIELAALGIHFSIDDFGTGYSSLAYLKRLPIHELKIDKTFVQDAPNDPNDAALVEAILAVATHLRLRVIAEGVETEEQARFLNVRATVIHQGYLYGKPEPALTWLTRWQDAACDVNNTCLAEPISPPPHHMPLCCSPWDEATPKPCKPAP